MPIIHMTDSMDKSYHAGAFCPIVWSEPRQRWTTGHSTWTDSTECDGDYSRWLVLYTTHHGLCISEREMNGRDDSDFYMLVWDPEAQAPHEICFATTRGWSYPCYGSRADASAEVLAEYEAWCARHKNAVREAHERQAVRELAVAADRPHKGAQVIVKRGRKIEPGTAGKVIHVAMRAPFHQSRSRWAVPKPKEAWLTLDTGTAFVEVLAAHCDLVAADPAYVQYVFDLAAA